MSVTITTTLGALANAEAALKKLLDMKFDRADGSKLRYHVTKLAKLVAAETAHFYDERNALVMQHGEGTPKAIRPDSPTWSTFVDAMKSLEAVPVTLSWGPLTTVMVEAYPEIVGADLIGLGPLYELDPVSAKETSEPV